MRLAFISDIHSNLHYLEKTLHAIDQHHVDRVYCLGDLVGYYDCPHEVIQACIAHQIRAVSGNHERFMLGTLEYEESKEHLYRIASQRRQLSDADMEFLAGLPDELEFTVQGRSFYLTHSLPGDCQKYQNDITSLDRDKVNRHDYYCFGHTHRALIGYHFGCCILNPGSTGQPRDYTAQPSFIVVDLDHDTIQLVKLRVDHQAYAAHLRESGYDIAALTALERTSYE